MFSEFADYFFSTSRFSSNHLLFDNFKQNAAYSFKLYLDALDTHYNYKKTSLLIFKGILEWK